MQRMFLCVLAVTLMAVFASPGYCADRPALLSQEEVGYHGLERAWYAQINVDGRLTSIEHTLLDRGTLFIVTSSANLIALDAETGKTLWTRNASAIGLLPYAPAANARTVALVCGNEVNVFDRRNGRLLWREVLPATPSTACQMSDYFLYVPMVDHRVACYELKELRAPSPALLELAKQYAAIGYTLNPYSGKVTRTSDEIVSTEDFILSQSGEKKPAPSAKLLELVDDYAALGLVLNPYTGEITESGAPAASLVSAESYTPLKGKRELDGLLEEELILIGKRDREEQRAKANGTTDETDEDAGAPYYLTPNKKVPMVCFSFGAALVQPVISYESADMEIVTWFTDRGYLFLAHASREDERVFALQHRIAISPMHSFLKESKMGHYRGSIERDITYSPAVVQKVVDDDKSRFLTVVGSTSGFVFAYDPKTSETRWWQSIGSPISGRLTVVKDRVYVPCLDGNFCCLDAQNGKVVWRSPGIDSFISASKDYIYVKNIFGDLVAINAKNGAQNSLFSIKAYEGTYYNNENDRIYLISNSGLIQCLYEAGRSQPLRHVYLPEAYLEYRETNEERRQLIIMPELSNNERRSSRTKTTGDSPTETVTETTPVVDDMPFDLPGPVSTTPEPELPEDNGGFDDSGFGFSDDDDFGGW